MKLDPIMLRLFAGVILLLLAIMVLKSNPSSDTIDYILVGLLTFFIGADLIKKQ